MKEIEKINKDVVKIVKQAEQEKQTVFVTRLRPMPGHKCFEYNLKENTICLASRKDEAIGFEEAQRGEIARKSKIEIKEDCVYATALNKKNAIKHFSIMLGYKVNPK